MNRPSSAKHLAVVALLAAGALARCSADPDADPLAWSRDARSGGALTVTDTTRDAYSRELPGLDDAHANQFFVGNSFFNMPWVTAPSSTEGRDGLGPTFNAPSCSACHFKDGRGRGPMTEDEPFEGLLLRLSVAGVDAHGGPVDEPTYGGQFNHRAVPGVMAEGTAVVRYTERPGAYPDGTAYSLRAPEYVFTALAFGPMRADVMVSPRVALANFGLGLLEAVTDDEILALADPDDRDGDGISGRPNHVWSLRLGRAVIGRFGWKANQPTLEQQNASAFAGDIGVTSSLVPALNCTGAQVACLAAPSGGSPELDDSKLAAVTVYTQALAVPARRDVSDPTVLRGAALFAQAGCASCHTPTLHTGPTSAIASLAGQTIHPFTDLLLHDMGEGLADRRPDFEATGSEWRTPPLWGIGLVRTVNRHTFFLHDGRARSLEEAVLWHGGEADRSRANFTAMSAQDRASLIRFLESL